MPYTSHRPLCSSASPITDIPCHICGVSTKNVMEVHLENIASAQERIAEINERTLKAYADTNQLTLEHMKARESREIFQAQRAAERHEWDRETYHRQQELIKAKIDEANRYIK